MLGAGHGWEAAQLPKALYLELQLPKTPMIKRLSKFTSVLPPRKVLMPRTTAYEARIPKLRELCERGTSRITAHGCLLDCK